MSAVKSNGHIQGTATLYAPDGTEIHKELPALLFTSEEARTLRDMKKILIKYRWEYICRCRECFGKGEPNAFVESHVLDDRIGFLCAHQQVVFKGQTL